MCYRCTVKIKRRRNESVNIVLLLQIKLSNIIFAVRASIYQQILLKTHWIDILENTKLKTNQLKRAISVTLISYSSSRKWKCATLRITSNIKFRHWWSILIVLSCLKYGNWFKNINIMNFCLYHTKKKPFKHVDSSFELTPWQNSHGEPQWK